VATSDCEYAVADDPWADASSPDGQAESPDQRPKPTLKKDLSQIRNIGLVIGMLVAAPSIPAFVGALLNLGPVEGLWNFFLGTAPLTATIAVLGISAALLRRFKRPGCGPYLAAIPVVLAATWCGFELGPGRAGLSGNLQEAIRRDYNVLTLPFALLLAYFETYGFWTFILCWLVGGFVAWVIGVKLAPYVFRVKIVVDKPEVPPAS
jgi:hypothetical protein